MTKFTSLHQRMRGPIAEELRKTLACDNTLALPRIRKVTVNVGLNRAKMEGKEMHEYIATMLAKITGQKPSFRTTNKSISNFKIRKGMVVGAMVTLRGRRMADFLDRLIHVALPRVRDFRGLPPQLDGHGNLNVGIRDHSIFPEVPPPEAKQIFGLQVTVSTTAAEDARALPLLRQVGFPFREEARRRRGKRSKMSRNETIAEAGSSAS